jgi:ATP-dependent DNA ligase
VAEKPLRERLDFLKQLFQHWSPVPHAVPPMYRVSEAIVGEQPRDAFARLTEKGCEGIVIKDLSKPYDTTGSRTKGGWVKWKKNVDPVDCFVSGFDASEADSRKGLVAALHFSCFTEKGEEIHLASCSNFDMEMRVDMSGVDAEGNVFLRDHWYGRVAEITGLAFSSVKQRIVHTVIREWRPDRSKDTCVIDSGILEKYKL